MIYESFTVIKYMGNALKQLQHFWLHPTRFCITTPHYQASSRLNTLIMTIQTLFLDVKSFLKPHLNLAGEQLRWRERHQYLLKGIEVVFSTFLSYLTQQKQWLPSSTKERINVKFCLLLSLKDTINLCA